jgi:flagellin-like protein
MSMSIDRKGITPVIAIVLLLMVTVGAVGVVYTQFQSLVQDPTSRIDEQQRNANTDITIVRGKSTNTNDPDAGSLVLEVENTGSVTRNTTSFRVTTDDASLSPGQVSGSTVSSNPGNSTLMDPDQVYDFYTGIPFPGPTDGVVVTLGLEGSQKTFDIDCRPQTSTTAFCQ